MFVARVVVVVALANLIAVASARADLATDHLYAEVQTLSAVVVGAGNGQPLQAPLPLSSQDAAHVLGLGVLLGDSVVRRWGTPAGVAELAANLTTSAPVPVGHGAAVAAVQATALPASPGDPITGVDITVTVEGDALAPFVLTGAPTGVYADASDSLAVHQRLSTTLRLRYEPSTGDTYLDTTTDVPRVTIDTSVTPTGALIGRVGVLGVNLIAPSSTAASLKGDSHIIVGFGGNPLLGRLRPVQGDATVLFANPSGAISGRVDLTADTTGLSSLSSLGGVGGSLTVADANVADGASPTYSLTGTRGLSDFANATPGVLLDAVQQSVQLSNAAQRGPADLPLPLLRGTFADAFAAGGPLSRFLTGHLNPGAATAGTPDFATVQGLERELAGSSAVAVVPGAVGWDPVSHHLGLPLHLTQRASRVSLDTAQGGFQDPHVGAFDAGHALGSATGIGSLSTIASTATASPSLTLDLPLVLDLSSDPTLGDAQRVALRTGTGDTPLLSLDLPIHTAVNATGTVGPLTIHAAGTYDETPPAGGHNLSVALKPIGTPGGRDVPLLTVINMLASDPASTLTVDHGAAMIAHLGIDVPGTGAFFGAGCANATAQDCGDLDISWPDVTDASTLTASGGALSTIAVAAAPGVSSTMLVAKAQAALRALSDGLSHLPVLAGSTASGPLNQAIPFVGASLGSLISTNALDSALNAGLSGPAVTSLNDLALRLNHVLGSASGLSFTVTGNGGSPRLLVHLHQQVAVERTVPLNLSLAGHGLTGAAGSGQVMLGGTMAVDLTAVVDLSGPVGTGVSVLPSSSVTLTAHADASGMLAASLGPLAVSLGAPGDPASFHAAVELGLADASAGTDPVSFDTWAQALVPKLNSHAAPVSCDSAETTGYNLDVCANLPLYVGSAQHLSKLISSGSDTIALRLPASDATFDVGGPDVPGPSGSPNLPRLEVPDLSGALQQAALSLADLRSGADAFLGLIRDGLTRAADDGKLPFVGKDLQEGSGFLQSLQQGVDGAFDALPADVTGLTANDVATAIEQQLNTHLASMLQSAISVQATCAGSPCSSGDPATAISDLRVSFDAGSTSGDLSHCQPGGSGCIGFSAPLNFGIPGLSLTSAGSVSAALGWHLHVAFGIDAQGFLVQPGNDLKVGVGVSVPDGLTAHLGPVQVQVTDLNQGGTPAFQGVFDVALTNATGEHLGQLLNEGSQAVTATLTARAAADWRLQATAGSALPGIQADLHLNWSWAPGAVPDTATQPEVLRFDNVAVTPSAFLRSVLGPVARDLNHALGPLQDYIGYLTTPIPVLSDLSHLGGGPDVTANALLGLAADLSGDARLTMASRIANLIIITNKINSALASNTPIPVGSFELNPGAALAGLPPEQIIVNAAAAPGKQWSGLKADLINAMFPNVQDAATLLLDQERSGFQFPVLDDPGKLFGLLLGQDVDVVTYDAGAIHEDLGRPLAGENFDLSQIVPLAVGAKGDAIIDAQFKAGYDTHGIRETVQSGGVGSILDGLYINTRDARGQESPNLAVAGDISLFGSASVGLASAEVDGTVHLAGRLGVYDGDGTGRFRPARAANQQLGCVFAASSTSDARLDIKATLGISPLSHDWNYNIAETPLWNVTSHCSGGGSGGGWRAYGGASGGKVHLPIIGTSTPIGSASAPQVNDRTRDVSAVQLNDRGELVEVRVSPNPGSRALVKIDASGHESVLGQNAPGALTGFNDAGEVLGTPPLEGLGLLPFKISVREPDGRVERLPTPDPALKFHSGYPGQDFWVLTNPGGGSCSGTVYGNSPNGAFMTSMRGETDLSRVSGGNGPVYVVGANADGVAVADDASHFGDQGHFHANAYVLDPKGVWQNLDTTLADVGLHITDVYTINDAGTMVVHAQQRGGQGYDGGPAGGVGLLSPSGVFTRLGPGFASYDTNVFTISRDGRTVTGNTQTVYHDGVGYDFSQQIAGLEGQSLQFNSHGTGLSGPNGGDIDPDGFFRVDVPGWHSPITGIRPGCHAPTAPQQLVAVTAGGTQTATISWKAPADAPSIMTYHVYRYTSVDHLEPFASVAASTFTVTDNAVPAGGARYAVSAENASGEGPVALATPLAAQATAQPGADATLKLPGGFGELDLPAGLVHQPTTFSYASPALEGHDGGKLRFLGQSFSIVARNASGVPVHQFASNYTMTLHYDPAALPAGTSESDLNLYFFANGDWQPRLPCSGCSLDTAHHTITVKLDHLTDFALLVPITQGGAGKADQAITFPPLGPYTFGRAPVTLGASASSTLAVGYSVASGPCTVSGSTLTITGAGSCVVTADQTGNANFNAAPTVTRTIVINKAMPVITWADPAPIAYGTPLSGVQLNATTSVAGSFAYAPPVGAVLSVGAGQALHATFTPTDTGSYTTATATAHITVNRASTTTSVAGAPNPSVTGQAVTLTATVAPSDGGGTVAFTDSGQPIAGCGARPVSAAAPHQATCTSSALGVGAHLITATYSGDPNHLGSTSIPARQQVDPAATSTTVSVSPAGPQTFGQPVTFTAGVAAVAPGAGTPTGTVAFTVDGVQVGSAGLSGGSASIMPASLSGGPHAVTATYGGDGNFTASSGSGRATVACQAVTGNHSGALIVTTSVCIRNAQIAGAVIVKAGGSLDVEHSAISGSVGTSSTPGAIRICDSQISGSVDVRNAGGLVIIGDPLIGCAPNTISGALIVKNNTHGARVINNTVRGAIDITANTGPGPGQNTTATTGNHH